MTTERFSQKWANLTPFCDFEVSKPDIFVIFNFPSKLFFFLNYKITFFFTKKILGPQWKNSQNFWHALANWVGWKNDLIPSLPRNEITYFARIVVRTKKVFLFQLPRTFYVKDQILATVIPNSNTQQDL